jgi:hypothetical protein
MPIQNLQSPCNDWMLGTLGMLDFISCEASNTFFATLFVALMAAISTGLL